MEKVIEHLVKPYEKITDKELFKERVLFRVNKIIKSLIEFESEKVDGKRIEVNVKLPLDIWGAVLKKIEEEGY